VDRFYKNKKQEQKDKSKRPHRGQKANCKNGRTKKRKRGFYMCKATQNEQETQKENGTVKQGSNILKLVPREASEISARDTKELEAIAFFLDSIDSLTHRLGDWRFLSQVLLTWFEKTSRNSEGMTSTLGIEEIEQVQQLLRYDYSQMKDQLNALHDIFLAFNKEFVGFQKGMEKRFWLSNARKEVRR
jgi:hypothetical protein